MPALPRRSKQIDGHPDRSKIEYDLARGVPIRAVAAKYDLNRGAVWRLSKQLPPQLRAAALNKTVVAAADLEQLRLDESNGLLQNLAMQRARLLLMQDHAMEIEDGVAVTRISGQIHKNLELVGQYLGEFARHTVQTSVNVLIQPEYLELRNRIVAALRPFPEARAAVAEVLHGMESRAAENASATSPAPPVMIEAQAVEASDAA